jgi:hypothetical protein
VRRRAKTLLLFWWDFLIGDDWTIAASVPVALAAAYGLHRAGVQAWWLVPLAALGVMSLRLGKR